MIFSPKQPEEARADSQTTKRKVALVAMDRRRDERRPRAGAGRRRRGDEHGYPAAKEAGNMVDLDSNPTKLIEIVENRQADADDPWFLTTFSIANDGRQIFRHHSGSVRVHLSAARSVNIMHLKTPNSAILSAVIFNALIIVLLDSSGDQGSNIGRSVRGSSASEFVDTARRNSGALSRHQVDDLPFRVGLSWEAVMFALYSVPRMPHNRIGPCCLV